MVSAGLWAGVQAASEEDLRKALSGVAPEDKAKLKEVLLKLAEPANKPAEPANKPAEPAKEEAAPAAPEAAETKEEDNHGFDPETLAKVKEAFGACDLDHSGFIE